MDLMFSLKYTISTEPTALRAMKDATQWHKASNQSKRNPRHEVTGDSPKDADVENLNRNVKDLSNEGAEVQTELNSVNQSECQILKPSCMLSELLEVAGKKTFDLMKNLDDLCSRHYHLLKVCDKMKKELEKLTVVKAGQRNEILQLRKLAKQQKREKNILAHQNNLLLQGLKQDNSTDALTLLQEIENLKRIIEDERAKYEKGLKRLQASLEGEENDSRAGALEERLKLVQRELQEALARAEAAEQKFKAPPLPPPPPPLMAAGESPVVPFRRRRSRATGEDPAKIRVQKFISQKKAAPGVNEDIINAIKERKFTLKKLKREGMVDSKENDKEAPKAVSELRNILGSLRKAPKKRQSQFRGDGQ
ncbi:shootin-1-like isoform X4 [Euwallacea fornicatus]|uniref:shootin-1-like isoform X4 n=1 Tax=Euwallacea fornicatus TaxID=995702 RepID=UPI00338DB0F1